jgi:hypothetical protein
LYDFMDQCDHHRLYREVEQWMHSKGMPIAAPPPNSFPSPYAPGALSFQRFTVTLVVSGQHFDCEIVLPVSVYRAPPSLKEAELAAEKRYGAILKNYVQSGGQTPLPSVVRHVGGSAYTGAQAYPQFTPQKTLGQVVKEHTEWMRKSMTEHELRALGYSEEQIKELMESGTHEDPPANEYACEADKPEGTRDPDKFLKEQQDKLWRGE